MANVTREAFEKKYGKGSYDKAVSALKAGKSIDEVKSMFNTTTKNTPAKTNSNNRNSTYTNYTQTTWNQVTRNTANWNTSDFWYMNDAGYWSSWYKWNKSINIDNDPDREAEIKYNVWQDQIVNWQLFKNRNDFNKYYDYEHSSPSQQKLLDELWLGANKYGMTSAENFYADNASKASDDKNMLKMKQAASTYNTLLPQLNAIRKKLDDRLWPVFDQLRSFQAKYLNDMSELRKLQNDYYAGMKREYDALAAGQSASVGSTLSGQGLSQSSIASTIDWVDKNWQSRYNDLMWKHIETLKWLQDSEQNFMTNYWTLMWNLTNVEQWALKDWYDSFNTLRNNLDKQYGTMIDERYNPYETITQAKVSWAADSWNKDATKRTVEINYKNWDEDTRINYIRSYLKSYFWDEAQVDKYVQYLRGAARNSNDINWAFEYLAKMTWNKQLASVPNTVNPNPDEINPEWWDGWEEEWWGSYWDFSNIKDTSFLDI